MDKKALSTVVVTVLIILVAIIAVVVVWVAIKPMIEKGAKGAGQAQECLALDLSIEKAVYNTISNKTIITIKRNVGEADLQKIKFLVDGTDKTPIETTLPSELETEIYTLNTTTKPGKIEIAGVISDNKICGIADTIEIGDIEEV